MFSMPDCRPSHPPTLSHGGICLQRSTDYKSLLQTPSESPLLSHSRCVVDQRHQPSAGKGTSSPSHKHRSLSTTTLQNGIPGLRHAVTLDNGTESACFSSAVLRRC